MASRARVLLVGALLLAAASLALTRGSEPDGSALAPGVALLAVAAIVAACVDRWWSQLAAAAIAVLVLANRLGNGLLTGLIGERGAGVAVGSWGLVVGCAVAAGLCRPVIAKRARRQRPTNSKRRSPAQGGASRVRHRQLGLALVLLLLSAICAEDLAAYDDTTGRPVELIGGAALFGALYGGPALIIREFVRRTGRGWFAILVFATAAGLVQAGLVDESLFNDDYRKIESWDELWGRTEVGALGLSAYATQSFVLGHVVYSFTAPIVLTEAIRPDVASRAWVGWKALAVVAILYVTVAGLVLADTLRNEPTHASPAQIFGTVAVVGALVIAALKLPRPSAAWTTQRRAPHPGVVLVAGFVAASLLALAPSTWAGLALSAAVLAASGALLVRASRQKGWELRHVVAVAAGAVLSRALLAFAYYPVIGEVSAARKYAHNVVMLLLVGLVIALAFARSRSPGARADGPEAATVAPP
jgi:hypothetical protein